MGNGLPGYYRSYDRGATQFSRPRRTPPFLKGKEASWRTIESQSPGTREKYLFSKGKDSENAPTKIVEKQSTAVKCKQDTPCGVECERDFDVAPRTDTADRCGVTSEGPPTDRPLPPTPLPSVAFPYSTRIQGSRRSKTVKENVDSLSSKGTTKKAVNEQFSFRINSCSVEEIASHSAFEHPSSSRNESADLIADTAEDRNLLFPGIRSQFLSKSLTESWQSASCRTIGKATEKAIAESINPSIRTLFSAEKEKIESFLSPPRSSPDETRGLPGNWQSNSCRSLPANPRKSAMKNTSTQPRMIPSSNQFSEVKVRLSCRRELLKRQRGRARNH